MTKIDVFVPCYGYGRLLAESVGSVLNQSERDLRVLIIDDASPDDTAEVAAELAATDDRVTWRRHQTNRGHICTYNEGLEWASADYTMLLSADDWILPDALSRAADLLDALPEVGFAYGPHFEWYEGDPRPEEPEPAPGWTVLSGTEFIRSNRSGNPVGTCTALVRTALQKRIGGYRHELPHAGDMEMWMRFAAHGPVGRLNAHQGVYRRHGRSMSEGYYRNMLVDVSQRKLTLDFLFEHYGSDMENSDDLRAYLYQGLADSAVRLASHPFSRADLRQFDEMMDFAARLDPAVRRSRTWRIQTIKRLIGPHVWSLLRPAQWRTHPISTRARSLG
jgi:glycosyltransferase involved in cell wall biosynthesis